MIERIVLNNFLYKTSSKMLVVFLCALLSPQVYGFEEIRDITWTLRNENSSIKVPGRVPGGVYSDLRNARIIGDILYRFNDVETRWVANETWIYEGIFNVPANYLEYYDASILVLEGVDTAAFIEVNDNPLTETTNMFVRYSFDIKKYIKTGENKLLATFVSPIKYATNRSALHFTQPDCVPEGYHGECHINQMRKMQASFGWDWGPAIPSIGLWRPVYIEFYNNAKVRDITINLLKEATFWRLKVKAFIEVSPGIQNFRGLVTAKLKMKLNRTITVSQNVGARVSKDGTLAVELEMHVVFTSVDLWWPNGYGSQPLYDLQVGVTSLPRSEDFHYKNIKIGFRTLRLIEKTASSVVDDVEAAKGLTFYFEVNDYPLFMKGSNLIPTNILPEYMGNNQTVDNLLLAAREAHMSMLRVWGGGVYESDYFYEKCDELGILIWQDFMFACAMYPVDPEFMLTIPQEVEQNVKRLQHHASIAVWAGNNENEAALRDNWYGTKNQFDRYRHEYIMLYVNYIKTIVEEIDPSRRYLVSSPSNGIASEQEGYIAMNPYDSHYGDTHYYNYLADNLDINIYPQTRFASEYGFQSLPSLSTLKNATMQKEDLSVRSPFSLHRQHSDFGYDNMALQMARYLKLDANDKDDFEKFIFYSQIMQAMAIKIETENYRQKQESWFTMGALYWQLNDVWQAPTWSGIEYGGRWKMLHYFAKTFFAPVLVSPRLLSSKDLEIYILNDRFEAIILSNIVLEVFNWTSIEPINVSKVPGTVGALSARRNMVIPLSGRTNLDEIFWRLSLTVDEKRITPYNYVYPVPFKDVVGLQKPTIKITATKSDELSNKISINVETNSIVLFFWLEVPFEGHFDDNGLILTNKNTNIIFYSKQKISSSDFLNSVTYKYYVN